MFQLLFREMFCNFQALSNCSKLRVTTTGANFFSEKKKKRKSIIRREKGGVFVRFLYRR